jgi:peptidoglycan/LPS O-acetylase OafA/YrhL
LLVIRLPRFLQFQRKQHNNLDFLRALAVVSVFIHHAQHVFGGNFPFFGEYGGQFGPQLFFLISGYLITASYETYNLKQFAIHRFFRIFPAYWLYFLGFGVASGVITTSRVVADPGGLLINLTLLQHQFPSSLLYFDVLHVTWTLTVELMWYVSVPVFIWAFGTMGWRLLAVSAVVSTLLSLLANFGLLDAIYPDLIRQNPAYRYLFLSNHFLVQLPFFLMGALIYKNREWLKGLNAAKMLTIGVMIFLLKPYYFVFNPLVLTGVALAFLMIAGMASDSINGRVTSLLSEISYSIYLCHFPVILYVHHQLGLVGALGVFVSILLTLSLSTLSYALVEKPGMRLGKRLADRFRYLPVRSAHE